ncbi:hypothetical protein C8Q74DRAFT_1369917 [Fomes fomentarius]|nr:hypothetical protein C8Q74DRAFT_1369917 [Fomes fomentarius]
MLFTNFMKAAFNLLFGYDINAVLDQEEHRWPSSLEGVPVPHRDEWDTFVCPEAHFSLAGHVPSRTLGSWRYRRFGAV